MSTSKHGFKMREGDTIQTSMGPKTVLTPHTLEQIAREKRAKKKRGIWAPGAKLANTLRALQKKGWRADDDGYRSPDTAISYSLEDACRIADIPVPKEKPGDAMWNWLRK